MRFSKSAYYGLPLASAILFILLALALEGLLPSGVSWTKAILLCLITLGTAGLAFASYRYADEVIMEREKSGMFWGSLSAAMLALPLMIGIGWGLLPLPGWLLAKTQPQLFVMGMVLMYLLQWGAFVAAKILRYKLQGR